MTPDPDGRPELDVEAIAARIEAAYAAVTGLCDGTQRWTMSVPARPDKDQDLVISAALRDAQDMLALFRRAEPSEGQEARKTTERVS